MFHVLRTNEEKSRVLFYKHRLSGSSFDKNAASLRETSKAKKHVKAS